MKLKIRSSHFFYSFIRLSQVILAVTSNIVLSLGMVGALSIVRFRTAIKEPLDIAFLFWAIAAGIILAAGMIPLAVIGSETRDEPSGNQMPQPPSMILSRRCCPTVLCRRSGDDAVCRTACRSGQPPA